MLSFGHMLPEATRLLATTTGSDGFKALTFALVGFMAMLFIEKVAFDHHDNDEQKVIKAPSKVSTTITTEKKPQKINSAMILCLAMSIHSFFEAAALGVANDLTSAYMMSACIALHQPAESIALLIAFLKTDMNSKAIVTWLSGFSIIALFGCLAGLLINAVASDKMEAVIVALAAGTFIYVGATEVSFQSSQT